MSVYTYRTNLVFSAAGCVEHDPVMTISYRVHPGSPQTRDDPGSEPYTEIIRAFANVAGEHCDLPAWMIADFFEADEELRAELLSSAAADEYASDQAADAKREEQRLERRP